MGTFPIVIIRQCAYFIYSSKVQGLFSKAQPPSHKQVGAGMTDPPLWLRGGRRVRDGVSVPGAIKLQS